MADSLKTGLVGAGVFARYHAGKIAASVKTEFVGVLDMDHARAQDLATRFETATFETLDALIRASDALIIASPSPSHFPLTKAALEGGCHVLVEKPLSLEGADALELAGLAHRNNLVLQVGHQERLVCDVLGLDKISARPERIDILRAGLPPQSGRAMDVSVIWDLMIHDIDLMHYLLGAGLEDAGIADAACSGIAKLGPELDHAHATFRLGGTAVSLEASRIAEKVQRDMKLVYADGEILLDFVARTVTNTTEHALNGDLASAVPDPLGAADEMFFKACLGLGEPLVTGAEAAQAVVSAELFSRLAKA